MKEEVENLGGREVVRDATGKFKKVKLDSATASAMGKRRWLKSQEESADSILQARGVNPTD